MPDLFQKCQTMISHGENLNEVIAYCRNQGTSKADCIKLVMRLKHVSLAESKKIVHLSPVWQDVHDRDEKFHTTIEAALNEKRYQAPKKGQAS